MDDGDCDSACLWRRGMETEWAGNCSSSNGGGALHSGASGTHHVLRIHAALCLPQARHLARTHGQLEVPGPVFPGKPASLVRGQHCSLEYSQHLLLPESGPALPGICGTAAAAPGSCIPRQCTTLRHHSVSWEPPLLTALELQELDLGYPSTGMGLVSQRLSMVGSAGSSTLLRRHLSSTLTRPHWPGCWKYTHL
ncbi:RIKEN cDNA 2610003J06, isoform CRA_a [Mus musculus]|nr:RIKEN cDNA 2610003J06, isoform CRA_a [Mus musculus]